MMKRTIALITAVTLVLAALTACTNHGMIDPTQSSDAAITEKLTAEPTVEPTAEPTAEPDVTASPLGIKYNEYEMNELRKFLDTPIGVEDYTNGELLTRNYVSEDPSTWANDEILFLLVYWTEAGNLRSFKVHFNDPPIAPAPDVMQKISGNITFTGFDELWSINLVSVSCDELLIENCSALEYMHLRNSEFKKIYIVSDIMDLTGWVQTEEFYWKCNSQLHNCIFEISLTTSGDGRVSCIKYCDEDRDHVFIEANAMDGSKFIGWYDEDGTLISTEGRIELSSDEMGGCQGVFNYTARFEEVP